MGGGVQLHSGASSTDDRTIKTTVADPAQQEHAGSAARREAKMLAGTRKVSLGREPDGAKADGEGRRCPPERSRAHVRNAEGETPSNVLADVTRRARRAGTEGWAPGTRATAPG